MGTPVQISDCSSCTVHTYGFLKPQWAIIDFLIQSPLQAGETFLVGDSVTTPEVYLNRQFRYSNGAHTLSPIYLAYLDSTTAYEKFWKPKMRIRRNPQGMAYSITDPEKNLHWLSPKANTEGGLEANFIAPATDEYEFFRGDDWSLAKSRIFIDGTELQNSGEKRLGAIRLEAGHSYQLKLAPLSGEPALGVDVPWVAYPKRDWDYEKLVFQGEQLGAFGFLGISRFSGVPSAAMSVDELRFLMSASGPDSLETRKRIIAKYHVRYLVLDPLLRNAFPNADDLLFKDTLLKKHVVAGTSVYEVLR